MNKLCISSQNKVEIKGQLRKDSCCRTSNSAKWSRTFSWQQTAMCNTVKQNEYITGQNWRFGDYRPHNPSMREWFLYVVYFVCLNFESEPHLYHTASFYLKKINKWHSEHSDTKPKGEPIVLNKMLSRNWTQFR